MKGTQTQVGSHSHHRHHDHHCCFVPESRLFKIPGTAAHQAPRPPSSPRVCSNSCPVTIITPPSPPPPSRPPSVSQTRLLGWPGATEPLPLQALPLASLFPMASTTPEAPDCFLTGPLPRPSLHPSLRCQPRAGAQEESTGEAPAHSAGTLSAQRGTVREERDTSTRKPPIPGPKSPQPNPPSALHVSP